MEITLEPASYASQWFMTNYVLHFNHETTLRIWDAFLVEGHKIIYRVAVAIFALHAEIYAKGDLEVIFTQMRSTSELIEPDELFKAALAVKLSTRKLLDLENEYSTKPDMSFAKFCML